MNSLNSMTSNLTATTLPTLNTDALAPNGSQVWKEYDSQLAIPEVAGTRIVKALYQVSPKTGKKARENSYVRIPTVHLTEDMIVARVAELSPYFLGFLQGVEDTVLKNAHKEGALNVFAPSLTIDALIEHLEASEAGQRLNKEKIGAWFDASISSYLLVAFMAKMGVSEETIQPEQAARLEQVLGAYKAKFESLAGGKAAIKEEDALSMVGVIEKAAEEAGASTAIGTRFIARLKAMSAKDEELLMAL